MSAPHNESAGLNRTDRELILGLRQDVRYIRQELDELSKAPTGALKDHEKRLRILENFRWWILGAVAGSAFLSSLMTRLLMR
jgi:hypothetical protein